MPSFDIVSKLDMQEIENAIFNATKEINQRYDFKGLTQASQGMKMFWC